MGLCKLIFISVTGDDDALGTIDNPVKTVAKARELASSFIGRKEVNIVFGDGTYYLPQTLVFNVNASGSKNILLYHVLPTKGRP